jgi:hypothetical protein
MGSRGISIFAGRRGGCSRSATHGVWRKDAQVAEAQEVEWHHYISGWLCCAVGAILIAVTVTEVDLNAVVLCFTLIGTAALFACTWQLMPQYIPLCVRNRTRGCVFCEASDSVSDHVNPHNVQCKSSALIP